MSDSFIFFASYAKAAKALPDKQRLEFYDALTDYGIYDKKPDELSPLVDALFCMALPYMEKAKAKQAAGSIGGKTSKITKQNSSKEKADDDNSSSELDEDDEDDDDDSDKQTISKTQANDKQNESIQQANLKQNESKTQANSKQYKIEIEIEKENKIEYNTLSPTSPPENVKAAKPPERERQSGFDMFWEAYPRKENRAAALKAWNEAPKETILQIPAILNAIEKHKLSRQWTQDGGRYIPSPARYISECRWKDQLAEAPKSDSSFNATEFFDLAVRKSQESMAGG